MARKQRTEGAAKRDLVKLCCFIALILAATLILVTNLLRLLGVTDAGSPIIGAMTLIKDIALLLGIVFSAFAFARSAGKGAVIVFWVAVAIYVASAICGLF